MTLSLKLDGVDVIVGGGEISGGPLRPYDDGACAFLAGLSAALRATTAAKAHPDIAAFAFWCRKGNIARLKKAFDDGRARLGRGIAFHVTPSNVAVNFAYSFAFGLLAGNANVVRVPSNPFPQVAIICDAIRDLLGQDDHAALRDANAFIGYGRDDNVTAYFSARCDARLIWGGDETIAHIRRFPIPVHGVEVGFADRYSFCVLDPAAVAALDDKDLRRLARGFYNDAYLMDQNACSSPHLVIWLGGDSTAARRRFWSAVERVVSADYGLESVFAVDKYGHLLETAAQRDDIGYIERAGNGVYRIGLDRLEPGIDELRGRFGTFFEHDAAGLDAVAAVVNAKFQTLTYFGVDSSTLRDFVTANGLAGIDRIVPVGQALDMDVIWDGMDLCERLSRIIDVR